MQPQLSFGQAMPWQTGQPQQQYPAPSQGLQQPPYAAPPQGMQQQPQYRRQGSNNRQAAPAQQSDQRVMDDRRLNDLAARFYGIKATDKHALKNLELLQQDVKSYHDSLFSRNSYNASDILTDTENLQKRIAKQIKSLRAKAKAQRPASNPVNGMPSQPAPQAAASSGITVPPGVPASH